MPRLSKPFSASGAAPKPGSRSSRLSLADAILICTLAGGGLLVLSQFLPLYHTHVAGVLPPVASGTVGGAHGWAVLPLGLLAIVFGVVASRAGSRPALLAVGLLGVAGLVIALGHDLSDAHARGLRYVGGAYAVAANKAAYGFFLESAGALVLLVACVCGFLMLGPPARERPDAERPEAGRRPPAPEPASGR
jgi:hypothetical protein